MIVSVQLFAAAKAAAGCSTKDISLPDQATVALLRTELMRELPALQALQSALLVAVNSTYADDAQVISSTDQIACFPPVSGG